MKAQSKTGLRARSIQQVQPKPEDFGPPSIFAHRASSRRSRGLSRPASEAAFADGSAARNPKEALGHMLHFLLAADTWVPYPKFVNPGDNAWQLTAATLVGLMSVPGLVVLYGGVMQKRWSVNAMMMSFIAFALVLVVWVLFGFKLAFGHPQNMFGFHHGIFANMWGRPGTILGHAAEQGQAAIPLITTGPAFHFPTSTLAYFQFVFAAITPILMLGSVLGRINFKAWIPFVILWSSL